MIPLWMAVTLDLAAAAVAFGVGWGCRAIRNYQYEQAAWNRGWNAGHDSRPVPAEDDEDHD